MKQTDPWLRRRASAATVLLLLSLFSVAGCSGSDGSDSEGGNFVVNRSELLALKKANKKPKAFKKALKKLKMDKLLKEGGLVETTTPGNTTKKTR